MVVDFDQQAIRVKDENGDMKWSPAFRLANGDFMPISHQGNILMYNTQEEAQQYFED